MLVNLFKSRFIGLVLHLLLHSIIIPLAFSALTVEVDKIGGKIMIKDNKCINVISELENMVVYARKMGIDTSAFEAGIKKLNPEEGCSVDISSILPDKVKAKIGRFPEYDGPNCFNFSLLSSGVIGEYRSVIDKEITSFMNGPFFKEIDTKLKGPGHVGVIVGPKEEPLHAFTILGEKLVFSKDGQSRYVPWEIKPMEDVFHNYGGKVKYFDCKSMENYLAEHQEHENDVKPLLEGWSIPDEDEEDGFFKVAGLHHLEDSLGCSLAEIEEDPIGHRDELLDYTGLIGQIVQNANYNYPLPKTKLALAFIENLSMWEASLRDLADKAHPAYESEVDALVKAKELSGKSKEVIWREIKKHGDLR